MKEESVYERYTGADFDASESGWPITIEVFNEWCRRYAGFVLLADELDRFLAGEDGERYREQEVIAATLAAGLKQGFSDLAELVGWATNNWNRESFRLAVITHDEKRAAIS